MYGIFTYMWLMSMVHVGKYSIHGSYKENYTNGSKGKGCKTKNLQLHSLLSRESQFGLVLYNDPDSWCKKSCTTWDVIKYQPQLVSWISEPSTVFSITHHALTKMGAHPPRYTNHCPSFPRLVLLAAETHRSPGVSASLKTDEMQAALHQSHQWFQ